MGYETPEIRDYGTVIQMTQALGINGTEDGGSKMLPLHHFPTPSAPLLP
jgi:hypothetical protein